MFRLSQRIANAFIQFHSLASLNLKEWTVTNESLSLFLLLGCDSWRISNMHEYFGHHEVSHNTQRQKRIGQLGCWTSRTRSRRGAPYHRRRTCWTLHFVCHTGPSVFFCKYHVQHYFMTLVILFICETNIFVHYRLKLNLHHSLSSHVRSFSLYIHGNWLVPTIAIETSNIYASLKYSPRWQHFVVHWNPQVSR